MALKRGGSGTGGRSAAPDSIDMRAKPKPRPSLFDLGRTVTSCAVVLITSSAVAQTPPDAGALQRQIEQQRPQAMPGERRSLVPEPSPMRGAAGVSVTVKTFRFAGNTLLSDAQLAPSVQPYLNRVLDFNGLQQAVAAVGEAYREAGWLARVYLPEQEIVDGVVTIQIVEAHFGEMRRDGPPPTRISEAQAQAYVSAVQARGEPLNADALDRAMLLIEDLPGAAVSGNFAPGRGQGETDLVLKYQDEPLLNGDISFDNAGARSTGRNRATLNAYLNSPLRIGDQAIATLLYSEGTNYGRIGYTLPVGHDGMRLGVSASTLSYRIVASEFSALHLKGDSDTWGVDAHYPLIRARTRNLYLNAYYEEKTYDNEANGATNSHYRVRNVNIGLVGNLFDRLGGGGANLAGLTVTAGEVDLGRPDAGENPALDGQFTKLGYQLSRQQYLSQAISLYALLSGQVADSNLDSSEKFYLGGANGVRAYPSNEGSGSEGMMLNLELRYRARPDVLLTGFYDWGQITQNHDNDVGPPANPNRYELQGAGIAASWSGPRGLNLRATYARRIGNNPNPTARGTDQDGSLTRDRFWLLASLPF